VSWAAIRGALGDPRGDTTEDTCDAADGTAETLLQLRVAHPQRRWPDKGIDYQWFLALLVTALQCERTLSKKVLGARN
jgi:hypothetical protein